MDELLISEEDMEVFEKIKSLKKEKYVMKDVDTICELLRVKLFWYQKFILLYHLNNKNYMRYICR